MERFILKDLFSRKATGGREERRTRPRVPIMGAYTILIADDSKTVVHALKGMLEQGGYRTLQAFDGESAVTVAREDKPDLILMDVVMPGLTGFQATRVLRKDMGTNHIPIVMISGSEQLTEKAWCLRLGARDFLPKPIQRGALFHTIESLLGLTELASA